MVAENDPEEPHALLLGNGMEPTSDDIPLVTQSTSSTTSDFTLQYMQQQIIMVQALMVQIQNPSGGTFNGPRKNKQNLCQMKYCHTHGASTIIAMSECKKFCE